MGYVRRYLNVGGCLPTMRSPSISRRAPLRRQGAQLTSLFVSDDQRNPRPPPRPRPQNSPTNFVVDRRKVVLGLGFGVAAAAGLRNLGTDDEPSTRLDTTNRTSNTDSPPITTNEVEQFEAPVLDSAARLQQGQTADTVFTSARIIDPETGFDRIGNVAIIGAKIVEISEEPIAAARTVDVTGHVISPGFIDILSYSPNGYGEWWKIADGVTSNIGMHGLRFDASDFFDRWTGKTPVHFGGAVHNSYIRERNGLDLFAAAGPADLSTISDAVQEQLDEGYIGIHTQPEYSPGVGPTEMADMAKAAERFGVPFTVHARFSDNQSPGTQSEAVTELVDVARTTGAHVHIEHLNSTGGTGRMLDALAQLDGARAEGLKMTACMYPYEFWATGLQTSRFTDWQTRYGLTYGDLQVAGTSDRLTEATYEEAYAANKLTAAYAIPPEDLVAGFGAPYMMIGSDAILESTHNNHPRSTGCFSRVLGKFVREDGVIPLIDALAMMTIRPAELLGTGAPAMRTKGRMQIGADADVTVFDPTTIIDNSTIADPAQQSTGVFHVMVDGVDVRAGGVNIETALPGRAVTSGSA